MRVIRFVDRLSAKLADVEWNQRPRRDRLKWVSVIGLEMAVVLTAAGAMLRRIEESLAVVLVFTLGVGVFFAVFLVLIVWRPKEAFRYGLLGAPFALMVMLATASIVAPEELEDQRIGGASRAPTCWKPRSPRTERHRQPYA